jgi:hypothetical protein
VENKILDVSDIHNIDLVCVYPEILTDLDAAGEYAYGIKLAFFGNASMYIYDISNPGTSVLKGGLGLTVMNKVDAAGDYVYVTDGMYACLRIVNIELSN